MVICLLRFFIMASVTHDFSQAAHVLTNNVSLSCNTRVHTGSSLLGSKSRQSFRFPTCRHRAVQTPQCGCSLVPHLAVVCVEVGCQPIIRMFWRCFVCSTAVKGHTASCRRPLVSQRFVISRVLCRLTHQRSDC